MRLGLIGRGKWGRKIEQTLQTLGDASIIAIGRDEGLRRDLDAVIIASPSAKHAELAVPYIEAGIATFIEKPMATSMVDAWRIQEAARESPAAVFVGHLHLYNPAFETVLKVLPTLGAVHYVLCDSANNNPRTDTSVLWDWLPHDLSMAQAIFGCDPSLVQAWSLTQRGPARAAVARYQNGAASFVSTVSWLSPLPRRQMTISAAQGVLIFDDRAGKKVILHSKDGRTSYPAHDSEPPLTRELRAFLDLVRARSIDASHVALGLAVAAAIEAAEQSIENGGCVVEIRA
jgi:predicted dehydrogenase